MAAIKPTPPTRSGGATAPGSVLYIFEQRPILCSVPRCHPASLGLNFNPTERRKRMARPHHYSPAIERFLVSFLYHEARHRKMPMTRLANQILKEQLAASAGWQLALQSLNSSDPKPVACQGK